MKTQNNFLGAILILGLALIIFSCSKDDPNVEAGPDPDPDPQATTFKEVVDRGNDFEPFPQFRTTDTVAGSEKTFNEDREREIADDKNKNPLLETVEERFVCTSKTVSVLDGSGKFPLFNTAADVIYPGSLLQGKSLRNVTPLPIVVKRAGGSLSYDLNNGNLSSSFSVDEVKKSTIQNGMNNIIAGAGEVVPANFKLDIIQVESESQLAVELGIDVKTFATQVSAGMSFSSEKKFNRTLVKLTQAYYTMSFDLPTSLDEVFDPSVTPEQLSTYVQADNPATFISSVTYGRIFYMLIESTSSRSEMQAKLNVAYGAFGNSVEGNVEVNAFNSLSNLKIKVIAYGGDSAGTFELTGETTVSAIANKLAESTDIRAGLPLSYVVRSVKRPDQIVGTKLATEYEVVNCELKGVLPPQGYRQLLDLFEDGIGAATQIAGSNVVVYNKAGDKYAWFNGSSGEVSKIFDITDPEGPMGVSAFSSIGAAIRFTDNKIYIFDGTGLKTEILNYTSGNLSGSSVPTAPIGTYNLNSSGNTVVYFVNDIFGDTDNFQFSGEGFEAAVRYYSDSSAGTPILHFFRKPGDRYADYRSIGGGVWKNPFSIGDWGDDSCPFDKIGAACRIEFGADNTRQLFFNKEGDKFSIWNPLAVSGDNQFSADWVVK